MKLTQKQVDEYIKDPSSCPSCSSPTIESPVNEDEHKNCNMVTSKVYCNTCGFKWAEVYTLTTIIY